MMAVTQVIIILAWGAVGHAEYGEQSNSQSEMIQPHLFSGSSLHAWDLTQRLSSYTSGLQTIDNDLAYLYGQLPSKIGDAANAVMDKAERKVQTDVFVAGINVLGTTFGSEEPNITVANP